LNVIRRCRWGALAALLALSWPPLPARAGSGQIWLAVSDIHLNLFDRSAHPSQYGFDTNLALFESAVAQMKRAVPDPAVVLISGDFLMHGLRRDAAHTPNAADDAGLESMRWIAAAFGRDFPKSRFAIALGNNDIPCGDYRSAAGSRYLAQVARIWKPLVDRDGASPDFEETFSRNGYYTAALPLRGLRLVALDTVPFSTEYQGNCGHPLDPAAGELAWLTRVLRDTPPGDRNIVLMHIPPGYDAFATQYLHDFIGWPFFKAPYEAQLLDALASSPGAVLFAIAGHTHRFDFRLARGIPILVLGALSPIYANNPAYYALALGPDGSLRDIGLYIFDEERQAWLPERSFDQMWGLPRLNAASLARLHALIAVSSAARATWNHQANGWSSSIDPPSEPWGKDWRVAWCAQDVRESGFAACAGIAERLRTLQSLIFFALIAAASITLVLVLKRRLRA
jgi:hypothetical protein